MNPEWESEALNLLLVMAIWIICLTFIMGFEKALFGVMGERLTLKLRLMLIEEIMHKQISWHDQENRAPGILTNAISANVASLNGMTSEVIVTLFELVCIVIIGMSAGTYFCW